MNNVGFRDLIAIVGVLIGFSGLLYSVGIPLPAASIFVIALGGVYFLARYVQRRRSKQFTLLEVTKYVVLEDDGGHVATFTRKSTQRANQAGLDEIWCRNIASDGEIRNITSDGVPVGPDCIVHELRLIHVKKKIQPPTTKGTLVRWELSYQMTDAFVNSSESLIHLVNTPTDLLRLKVQFPPHRIAKEAVVWENYGDTAPKCIQKIESRGESISAEVEHPKLGGQYSLAWSW